MNRIEGALRLVRVRRGYSDKVSVAHNEHASHGLCSAVIGGSERRTERRRAQHFTVKDAHRPQIRRELVPPGNERAAVYFGNRFSRNRPLRCRGDGIFRGGILRERLSPAQFPRLNPPPTY